jgi:CubicO group peptidase (beta-lactamase class C family)
MSKYKKMTIRKIPLYIFVFLMMIIFLMTFSLSGCKYNVLLREKIWSKIKSDQSQPESFQSDNESEFIKVDSYPEGDKPLNQGESEQFTQSIETVNNCSTMIFPDPDWQESKPEAQGIDSKMLETALSYLQDNSGSDGIKKLIIIRNGYMVWKGTEIDRIQGVWSLTKPFTSTVLGLLIDEGKVTFDTFAKDFAPSMEDTYPDVMLWHFTTMTSGYFAIGDEPDGGYEHGPSVTPFKPAPLPLFEPPGTVYAYWDSAMNQFANILTQIANEPIEELFKKRIADPIGIYREKFDWGDFDILNGIIINSGSGNRGTYIRISASELARFGHLFLNKGKWENVQLISESWVNNATKAQVPVSIPLEPQSGADGRGVYGYNWWVNDIKPDGERKWPGAPPGTYGGIGYYNNVMFIIPEWKMVIVRLGLDQNEFIITDSIYGTFLKKVGQAITVQ